jgi:hypothetical protein
LIPSSDFGVVLQSVPGGARIHFVEKNHAHHKSTGTMQNATGSGGGQVVDAIDPALWGQSFWDTLERLLLIKKSVTK